jgi:hypothetical protein
VTSTGGRRRLSRAAAGIIVTVGLGTVLAACGNNAESLAQQACAHINRSIALLQESDRPSDAPRSAQLSQQAYTQLRLALPIAAEASYRDGQWQALMTTVSESNRVPETTLVPALEAQCGAAASTPFNQAPAPTSIPPPAPVSSSP